MSAMVGKPTLAQPQLWAEDGRELRDSITETIVKGASFGQPVRSQAHMTVLGTALLAKGSAMVGGTRVAIRYSALSAALTCAALATCAAAENHPAGQRPPSLEPFLADTKADEMQLALTAAPASITLHADVMTLGRHGYVLARKGDNGFVCIVDRSWATDVTDIEFWNIRVRQPACCNPAAVHSVLPTYLERTRWVLAGASLSQIDTRTRAAVEQKRIRPPEAGAMIYMMSKQGYLGDVLSKHPHPHLMFFLPKRGPEALGANEPGVPVFSVDGHEQPFAIFFVLVPNWSDGTPAPSLPRGPSGGRYRAWPTSAELSAGKRNEPSVQFSNVGQGIRGLALPHRGKSTGFCVDTAFTRLRLIPVKAL